jgi:hypothetical protein
MAAASTSTVTTTASDKLRAFMAMSDRERGVSIQRVEGHITWLHDFKAAFNRWMQQTGCTNAVLLDAAALHMFGYMVSKKEGVYVCKGCRQLAKARGGRCCEMYNNSNRGKKVVIYDMCMQTP